MPQLPSSVTTCLFDLDGVFTSTETLHTRAWATTFDTFLRNRSDQGGQAFEAFDPHHDYITYVDGKRRTDGVRSFLESRGIELPEGSAQDEAWEPTINGIGNAKNEMFNDLMETEGVEQRPGTRDYLEKMRSEGKRIAVVSSSANAPTILQVTGLDEYVEVTVDGSYATAHDLAGKPKPDTFLRAAELLGATPEQCVVYEDALSGVRAGKAGGFGYVIGIDAAGQAEALYEAGAHVVVKNLGELL